MHSDEPLSRIPPPKRNTNFVSQRESLRSSEDYRKRRARQGEPRRKGQRRHAKLVRVPKEWVIGGGLLALVLVAASGLWIAGQMKTKTKTVPRASASVVAADDGYALPLAKWQGPIPSEVADSFIAARTHEARMRWVRNPEQVGSMMKAFFEDGPGASEKVRSIRPLPTMVSGEMLYEEFQVEIEGETGRLLSVSIDPQGAKVDFESYARHGSTSWEEVLSGTGETVDEVRVLLQRDGYYLHRFDDEAKWQHFKATSPDLSEGLDFYVERESPVARELEDVPLGRVRATLSIRSIDGSAAHRQFEITALKALSWAKP